MQTPVLTDIATGWTECAPLLAIDHVVERDEAAGLAAAPIVGHLRLRHQREPLVHGAALVRLVVTEGDPAVSANARSASA